MSVAPHHERSSLVEEFALLFEHGGHPRMAGRVLGELVLTSEDALTQSEITHALGASSGSVSTMLRLLIELGMVERVPSPGARRYRVRDDAWRVVLGRMVEQTSKLGPIAERALELPLDEHARSVIEDMRSYWLFLDPGYHALVDAYDKRARKRR